MEEYDITIELMRIVDNVFRRNNITYAMIGGTLLGSYYHHDMVPWDDDADLVVDATNMGRVMYLLGTAHANYSVTRIDWPIIKFFKKDGYQVPSCKWTWPLIDIFFYRMTEKYWWVSRHAIMPLDVVFPLHLRPFGPLWVPSPNDAQKYIDIEQRFYNRTRTCTSNWFSHKKEEALQSITVPCERLMKSYPFVADRRPTAHARQFIEVVRIRNETVQELLIPFRL